MNMEGRETQTISLRVTAEELADLDRRAAEAGTSRPEYIRARLFAPDHNSRIAELEKQMNRLTDQLSRSTELQEARRCGNPEHAKIYGVGHCFDCDLPIASRH
jgi:hypothetical protein